MKKILFLLLLSIAGYGQTSTGQEQEFDYGIKNNSTQTITTPTYLTTTGMDGTQGKIPSALIAKTSDIADSLATKENIANKSDSYTTSSSTTYASTKAIVDGLATKQNTLTNPITGTGTTNYVPKFTASGTVGNSSIQDSGSLVSVNSLSEFKGTAASDGGQLGLELTTTATGTNWTGTGFATGYTHTTGSVVPLTSTLAAVTNNLYQITYTITGRTTGSITINYGGIAISGITASGNSGPKAISTATLNIVPTTDFNGTIVLSIKAISASVATTNFKNSSGTVANEIRAHSNNTNFSIGIGAGQSITTGNFNSAVGTSALANNTTGNYNSAVGEGALRSNTTGSSNSAVGASALLNNTTGNYNSAVGYLALPNNTTGNYNSAIGYSSLQINTTGSSNNAIGVSALANNTTGNYNSAVGVSALRSNTTGSSNSAVGQNALVNNTTGNYNNAIGEGALANNTTGSSNSAVGQNALVNNTTGNYNSAVGEGAGRYIANKSTPATIVNNSVLIGSRTSPLADNQTNQVVIGYDATGLGSNTTVIGNSSTTTARVYGRQLVNTSTDNGTDQLQVDGSTKTTALTLSTAPTTSTGTYDILTRNTSTGVVEKVLSSSVATVASPTFTGTPTAPTVPAGTNTTQIATTAFVTGGLATKENAFSKNTAFNKNFGTTAGTVLEGGTLGSNAYSSTPYLPLSGGDINGLLKITRDGYQLSLTGLDQGAVDLYKSGALGHRLFSDGYSFGIYDFENDSTVLSISKATEAATFSSTVTATSFNGSATLTGTPTAPTAPAGTNTTQIATTAFVQANSSSGSYTPTLTNTTNVSSSTLNAAYYVRNGNIVTVTIAVQLTLTATTETVFTFSLPISGATVVSGIGQGNMTSGGGAVNSYGIVDITNSTTAQLRMGSLAVLGSGSGIANIMFTYSL